MLQTFINTIITLIASAAAFGVLIHDTQLDKAATVALTAPIVALGYAGVDSIIKSNDAHIHVERFSSSKVNMFGTSLPRLNPRDDDLYTEKQRKGITPHAGSSNYIWPSV